MHYGTLLMDKNRQWAVSKDQLWSQLGISEWSLVLHPVRRHDGQHSQLLWCADGKSTEVHQSFTAQIPQQAAHSVIEMCEVWWSSCDPGCTLQYHYHQWPLERKWIPSPQRSRNHCWQMIFLDLHPLSTFILQNIFCNQSWSSAAGWLVQWLFIIQIWIHEVKM